MKVDEALLWARARLADADFDPALREANLLLARTLGRSEAQLLAHGGDVVDQVLLAEFQARVDRRLSGEPVAYILGEKEFFGRDFFVDSRVLIPRPETEHIVELALRLGLPSGGRILDIGTGSGCLAVTLLASGKIGEAEKTHESHLTATLGQGTGLPNIRRHESLRNSFV